VGVISEPIVGLTRGIAVFHPWHYRFAPWHYRPPADIPERDPTGKGDLFIQDRNDKIGKRFPDHLLEAIEKRGNRFSNTARGANPDP
jgi:hypothetical protein